MGFLHDTSNTGWDGITPRLDLRISGAQASRFAAPLCRSQRAVSTMTKKLRWASPSRLRLAQLERDLDMRLDRSTHTSRRQNINYNKSPHPLTFSRVPKKNGLKLATRTGNRLLSRKPPVSIFSSRARASARLFLLPSKPSSAVQHVLCLFDVR